MLMLDQTPMNFKEDFFFERKEGETSQSFIVFYCNTLYEPPKGFVKLWLVRKKY
jgi:hypothetical protein